jgi:hypothetical protein
MKDDPRNPGSNPPDKALPKVTMHIEFLMAILSRRLTSKYMPECRLVGATRCQSGLKAATAQKVETPRRTHISARKIWFWSTPSTFISKNLGNTPGGR